MKKYISMYGLSWRVELVAFDLKTDQTGSEKFNIFNNGVAFASIVKRSPEEIKQTGRYDIFEKTNCNTELNWHSSLDLRHSLTEKVHFVYESIEADYLEDNDVNMRYASPEEITKLKNLAKGKEVTLKYALGNAMAYYTDESATFKFLDLCISAPASDLYHDDSTQVLGIN